MKYLTIFMSAVLLCCGNSRKTTGLEHSKTNLQLEGPTGTYRIVLLHDAKEIPEELTISFDVNSKQVSGFAGCNNFTGTYNRAGSTISIGPLASTRRFCKRFMDLEQHYLASLETIDSFRLIDGNLELLSKDMVLIKGRQDMTEDSVRLDEHQIEYTISSRGIYTHVSISNGMIKIQKDRNHLEVAETRSCTKEELEAIEKLTSTLNLQALSSYEAPTDKRLYDGAPSAILKISHLGQLYQTPNFDHGHPNAHIAPLVNTIADMAKLPK